MPRFRPSRLLSLLVTTAVVAGQGHAAAASKPTLFLNIVVEGLSEENLDKLHDVFGNEGFNRLRNQGVTLADVVYGKGIDATAATSMLVTGAPATLSGIPSATVFDKTLRQSRNVLDDEQRRPSPTALPVSTLADEIRVSEGGVNHVYSFAADPQQAVLLAGHAGNAAVWISDVNGAWTTSGAYYTEMPPAVANANFSAPLSTRLDTLRWAPALNVADYPGIPSYKKAYPFRYIYQRNDPNRYRAFKASAPANAELSTMATNVISSLGLGKADRLDMVSIAWSVAPYPYSKDADSRLETLDKYVRLDATLAALFKAIDERGPGMDRTLVMLSGVPAPALGKRDDDRFNIPYGRFSPRKATALLNVYLMALHGNGDWVAGYHEGQFHLNNKLIHDRNVDEQSIRRQSAEFLKRMAGICEARTLDDVVAGNADTAGLRRNTSLTSAGDIFVTITPGWEIADDDESGNAAMRPMVSRLATASFPVFMMGADLEPREVSVETDACALAPTVARLLRIRAPNAAAVKPLRL